MKSTLYHPLLCLITFILILQKRGPQRSVDMLVSAAFIITLLLLTFLIVELLKVSWSDHGSTSAPLSAPCDSQAVLQSNNSSLKQSSSCRKRTLVSMQL